MTTVIPLPHLMPDAVEGDIERLFENVVDSEDTVYTVPADTVAYVLDVWVNGKNDNAATKNARMTFYDGDDTELIRWIFDCAATSIVQQFMPFVVLPKLVEDDYITFYTNHADYNIKITMRILEVSA